MEDAKHHMPHSPLTTNSLLQKEARRKRRLILLQKRPKTGQDYVLFQVPSIPNISATGIRNHSSYLVMEIETPNRGKEVNPFNQISTSSSSSVAANSPQTPIMTLRGTSVQFTSTSPLSNLTTTEINMSYSTKNSYRGQCSNPKFKSSANQSIRDENCSPNELMHLSPSQSSPMTSKSQLTTLQMNLTPLLNQIDMVENSSPTNKVLQQQARHKRMMIHAHKRCQRPKTVGNSNDRRDLFRSSCSSNLNVRKPLTKLTASHLNVTATQTPVLSANRNPPNAHERRSDGPQNRPSSSSQHYSCRSPLSELTMSHLNGSADENHVLQEENVPTILGADEDALCSEADNNEVVHNYVMQSDDEVYLDIDYHDIGDPTSVCRFCGAKLWPDERVRNQQNTSSPKFYLCCGCGKTSLPKFSEPPLRIKELVFDIANPKRQNFLENIRAYNTMFSFTSMGGKIDKTVNNNRGPYTFRLYGENYHRLGSLLPNEGQSPKFAQLYIYDIENEIKNRVSAIWYAVNYCCKFDKLF